jgi:hypothetical protein
LGKVISDSGLDSGSHAPRGNRLSPTLCVAWSDPEHHGHCVPTRSVGTRGEICMLFPELPTRNSCVPRRSSPGPSCPIVHWLRGKIRAAIVALQRAAISGPGMRSKNTPKPGPVNCRTNKPTAIHAANPTTAAGPVASPRPRCISAVNQRTRKLTMLNRHHEESCLF